MKQEHLKAGKNDLKGKAKETAGKMTDNEKLEAEGKLDQLKAKAQDFVGDVKDLVN